MIDEDLTPAGSNCGEVCSPSKSFIRTLRDRVDRIAPGSFLALVLIAVIISRVALILVTPSLGNHIDMSIYREVGQLIIRGVDPYDFSRQLAVREELRTDGVGATAWVTENLDRYNYYVSSNLPASTLLYGAIEFLSGGSVFWWRIAFVLGDLALAVCAYFFLRHAGNALRHLEGKFAFFVLVVAYPSLVIWGTIIPEEKQFQTALMLLIAGFLIASPGARTAIFRSAAAGAVAALSILYKALGAAMLPLAVKHFAARPKGEVVAFSLAFLVVTWVSFWMFSDSFVRLTLQRTYAGSHFLPTHGSPWVLMHAQGAEYARLVVVLAAAILCLAAYHRRRLDLLNCLASLLVIFICLWITNGSMDRMNMTMLFALICLATVCSDWWKLALLNAMAQAIVYALGVGIWGVVFGRGVWQTIETCDAISTALFVITYLYWIARLRPTVGRKVLEPV